MSGATDFLIGCEEGLLPHSLAEGFSQIEEKERRLFYVAITRAKTSLYLSYLTERDSAPRYPSPYISEMQASAEINSGRISDSEFSELLKKMRRYGEEIDQFKRDNPSSISTAIADGLGEGPGVAKSATLAKVSCRRLVKHSQTQWPRCIDTA